MLLPKTKIFTEFKRFVASSPKTSHEIATQIGIRYVTLNRILNGRQTPSLKLLYKIKHITGLSYEAILEPYEYYFAKRNNIDIEG